MTPFADVRVRIAPSPTGYLHVGTARTALFNYMFAKRHGGQFILRIEDTDRERSKDEYTHNIFESLKALGLQWDEGPDKGGPAGPYRQTERLVLYQDWAAKLLQAGLAYHSYWTPAELEAERQRAQAEKHQEVFVDRCRDPEFREHLAQQPTADGSPRKPSLKFRIPDGRGDVVFQDLIRGEVSFDTALIGDFVIMKSDGTPSYNFAVVVDDLLMRISHVIRGEDHISNTPKQILLYEALQAPTPQFAHVSMILAPDRSKLSKRHGAVAVSDYIREGYLPEAFCNFLALLGWSPPDGEEVAPLSQFISQFDLGRITLSPAIFEKDKLNHINGKVIRQLPMSQFLVLARPYLHDFDLDSYAPEQLALLLDAVRERICLLSELPAQVDYFFGQSVILDAKLVGEVLAGPEAIAVLQCFQNEFLPTADFASPETLEPGIKAFTERLKPLKTKTVMWAVRAAITGRVQGIDLSKTLYLLGRDRLQHRVETALVLANGQAV